MGLGEVREKLVKAAEHGSQTIELEYGDAAYLYDLADAVWEATFADDGRQRKHFDRASSLMADWEVESWQEDGQG